MPSFHIISVIPELIQAHLSYKPFTKAQELKVASYQIWPLRKYALDTYGTIDDKPYGGGVGMILMIEPIFKALCDIHQLDSNTTSINGLPKRHPKNKIVVLSPTGKKFTQKMAEEWTQAENITLICGRYEGIDSRVAEHLATEVVSIGDYVLSGGEVPALVIMESVTRLLPGVLEKQDASAIESFSEKTNHQGEYPQYSRPANFKGLTIPEILLSGDHQKIAQWRKENLSYPKD